jgi:phospholipid transport system substrate-binding protein
MLVRGLRSLFLLALLCVAPITARAVTSTDGAAEFIQSLANQAIEVLRSQEATLAEREARFHALLKKGFAVRTIGRFVLGSYWRKATPAQREEYLALFSEWVVKTYAVRFGGYTDERFTIAGTRVNEADGDIFVATHIDKPGSELVYRANWRVRDMSGGYRIIDIEVEGVSMALTQRDEFKSVARRQGIEGLLRTLRESIAKLDQQAG